MDRRSGIDASFHLFQQHSLAAHAAKPSPSLSMKLYILYLRTDRMLM